MARHTQPNPAAEAALARVRGRARTMRPNIRRLAAFASVHSCPTAAVAFAARIDTNRLLAGTTMQMPYGQSPFAIGRGVAFEALLRRHGHAELRQVLSDGLGVDFSLAAIENLREGYQPNLEGLKVRASVTRRRMAEIVSAPDEPVVLDGAVLRANIGGLPAFFEADEMAIGVSGEIIVGENNGNRVIPCNGRDVEVDGNQNTITLTGSCAVILVNGNHNRVAVESVTWLRLIGSDNQVSWARGAGSRAPSTGRSS